MESKERIVKSFHEWPATLNFTVLVTWTEYLALQKLLPQSYHEPANSEPLPSPCTIPSIWFTCTPNIYKCNLTTSTFPHQHHQPYWTQSAGLKYQPDHSVLGFSCSALYHILNPYSSKLKREVSFTQTPILRSWKAKSPSLTEFTPCRQNHCWNVI
jgi:hypothetical protein